MLCHQLQVWILLLLQVTNQAHKHKHPTRTCTQTHTHKHTYTHLFSSPDKRFLVKTIKQAECKMLLKLLPDYFRRLVECPDSLLIKFFGVHRIQAKQDKKKRVYITIMQNVFCTQLPIHLRFDLKGSSVKRRGAYLPRPHLNTLSRCPPLFPSFRGGESPALSNTERQ